jgi:hypothetical protein
MKKMLSLFTIIVIGLSLTSCDIANNKPDTKDNSEIKQPQAEPLNTKGVKITATTDFEKATEIYNQFLKGHVSIGEIDIDYLTIPTGEPDKRYAASYAFADSNGEYSGANCAVRAENECGESGKIVQSARKAVQ